MVKTKRDLTGVVFGRLTVIEQAEDRVRPDGSRSAQWLCQCSCGSLPKVISQLCILNGNTKSCGCLHRDTVINRCTTHGKCHSKEYNSWYAMIVRCTNPKSQAYHDYGARGISVCDDWLNSFEAFYEDMGDKPEGYSLDRIDVNGNYCKENCKWSARGEQNYNQRKRKDNKAGKAGVHWSTEAQKWKASIQKDGKRVHLGNFIRLEDAVAAREAAEIELYGYNKE